MTNMNFMKTILHISKYYYPDLGGIETVAMYLAEGMADYNNIVVCFSKDNTYHEDTVNGIKVYRMPVNFSFMSQDVSYSYYKRLKGIFNQYQPNFVHVHCPNPFVYPIVTSVIRKDTKLVLHWHSDILSKGIAYNIIKPFESHILKRADLIISTSPNYIPYSKPLTQHKEKVEVAQNGLITSNFDLKEGDIKKIQEIKNKYDNKPIVYFVGRHIPYKGIDYLIRADQYIKNDCVILIAGTGPEDKYLKSIPCSNRIKFLGSLSNDELRWYSYAGDVFAFPSINKAEAFGIALAEAMYCKSVPVTFTIEGSGVNWVSLKGKTGEQVALKDIPAFAAAIDKIISNPKLKTKYAKASKQRILDMFTTEKAVQAMLAAYHSLDA